MNFRAGEKELREAFASLSPELKQPGQSKDTLSLQPACSSSFLRSLGERDLLSQTGTQAQVKEVLRTVLIEVECILNSNFSGYVSSNIADLDPGTPSLLLMGRLNGSLPQVLYQNKELHSSLRWRHSQILTDHFWSSFVRHY